MLQKQEEKGARRLLETPPPIPFLSTAPVVVLVNFSPVFKFEKLVVLCIFVSNRVSNGARTTPNLPSKLEKHTPNVSLYGPILHFYLFWGEIHT
uniref:Uncharacterized protein n=1 Tax=Lactuca sativa TaxID=4236 RepID=A0A9R1VA34_LACSA|nr:hypothetical protein LSAT_V11C600300910 [Lactuca sativa]